MMMTTAMMTAMLTAMVTMYMYGDDDDDDGDAASAVIELFNGKLERNASNKATMRALLTTLRADDKQCNN